jgi:hypothetical protein
MFDRDYRLEGKHATFTKHLKDNIQVFDRFIDVYMIGALIGFLHGVQSEKDSSTNDTASMLASVFIGEKDKCEFIYRLIMLMDTSTGLNAEQRIDRAFKDDADEIAIKNNMVLFNSYVLGGIKVLYGKFSSTIAPSDDNLDVIYKFVSEFQQDIDNIGIDELLSKTAR